MAVAVVVTGNHWLLDIPAGLALTVVGLLAARARASGLSEVVLRVYPDNAAALACYAGAAFERYGPQEEAAFNRGQPREYVWMRLGPSAG